LGSPLELGKQKGPRSNRGWRNGWPADKRGGTRKKGVVGKTQKKGTIKKRRDKSQRGLVPFRANLHQTE